GQHIRVPGSARSTKKKKRAINLCLACARRFVRDRHSPAKNLPKRSLIRRNDSGYRQIWREFRSFDASPSRFRLTSLTTLVRNVRNQPLQLVGSPREHAYGGMGSRD